MMKRISILLLAMATLSASAQHPGADSPAPVTLRSMQDHIRPLLVFAPSATPLVIEQLQALTHSIPDLRDRDVLIVPLLLNEDHKPIGAVLTPAIIGSMSAAEQAAARRRFHIQPNKFTVILIGKDGGEKLRSHTPISLDTLRSTIDAMPMRQEEMRSKPKP